MGRERKIIKIRVQINKIINRKPIDKINEAKSWLFEMINKIAKLLVRLIMQKRERTQIKSEKRLQLTPQQYKGSLMNTMKNYIPTNLTI